MRLGFDLCPEEQDFICKRKKYVAAALKNVLRLEGELQDNEVWPVAEQRKRSKESGGDG